MFTRFTDWLFGIHPSSDNCKCELHRLEELHKQHVEPEPDWLYAHDPIHKAHKEQLLRHGRRVEHHGREFWKSPREDHPECDLHDQHIPQIAAVDTDREMAREHSIRSFDLLTLHDCMEEPGETIQTYH